MDNPWIIINQDLVKLVMQDLYEDGLKYTQLPKSLIQGLHDALRETVDGCDHSVGICMCEEMGLLDALAYILEGKWPCPECNGESYVWFNEHNDKCAQYRAEGFDCTDAHYFPCSNSVCQSGYVPYDTVVTKDKLNEKV